MAFKFALRRKLADKPLIRVVSIAILLGLLVNVAIPLLSLMYTMVFLSLQFLGASLDEIYFILEFYGTGIIILFISILISIFLYRSGRKATVSETTTMKTPWQLLTSIIILFLFLSGIAGSIWCYKNHICMDGHMAHPPYPTWYIYIDATWVIALLASSILSTYMKKPMAPVFAYFSTYIIIYRFVMDRGGVSGFLP